MFPKFDKNKNQTINITEYLNFINAMLTTSGKNKMDLCDVKDLIVVKEYFDCGDKDRNGYLDKDEFKKDVSKRLNEFIEGKW